MECRLCFNCFPTTKELAKHQIQHCVLKLERISHNFKNRTRKICSISEQIQNYKCLDCKEKFASKPDYELHRLIHLKYEGQLECTQCNKIFKRKDHLKIHLLRHFDIKNHACSFCDMKFVNKQQLVAHLPKHVDEKPYECKICQKQFALNSYLTVHLESHRNYRSFKCSECEKSYKTVKSLRTHIRIVHKEHLKVNTCKFCGKNYHFVSSLNDHLRIHTKEKPYNCNQCSASFSTQNSLNKHITQNHARLRPYKCKYCEAKFALKSPLNRHIRQTHINIGRFKCQLCSKAYSSKSHLMRHQYAHSAAEPYECPHCDKKFNSPDYYKRHVNVVHAAEKLFPCTHLGCDQRFKDHSGRAKHIKYKHVEPDKKCKFKCNHCDKLFSTNENKNSHISSIHLHDKEYTCIFCSKVFYVKGALTLHLRVHTGEKSH